MPTSSAAQPIVFTTEDGLVTFVFTVGQDLESPQRELIVTAEIELFWEGASPPEPVTAVVRLRQPAQLAHISDDGSTLDGTLSLARMPGDKLAIVADVYYGARDDHHVVGVLASFTPGQG
jgi:hypothetical protein